VLFIGLPYCPLRNYVHFASMSPITGYMARQVATKCYSLFGNYPEISELIILRNFKEFSVDIVTKCYSQVFAKRT